MSATEDLIEIRDILARMHDARVGIRHRDPGMSLTELAALRDSIARINRIVADALKVQKEPTP